MNIALVSGGLASTVMLYTNKVEIDNVVYVYWPGQNQLRGIYVAAHSMQLGKKFERVSVDVKLNAMALIGLAKALNGETGKIFTGLNESNCSLECFAALKVAVATTGAKLEAPLIKLSRRRIAVLGDEIALDVTKTWDCELSQGSNHCGGCGPCNIRKDALSGFDFTRYLD